MKLYEIDKELAAIWQEISELEEIPNETLERLDKLQLTHDEKIKACGHVLKTLKTYAKVLSEEEKILAKRRRAAERDYNWLEQYVANSLGEGNKRDFGTVIVSCRSSEKLFIPDEEAVPPQYTRAIYEPDKKQITEDIKAGATIPFAHLVKKLYLVIE